MFSKTALFALAAAIAAVEAATPQGFNYGSTLGGKARTYSDFYNDFKGAQNLKGAPGTFNAARLYTMVDAGDASQPIAALKAAMDTETYLLLGMWASGASTGFDNEMNMLTKAINEMPGLSKYVLGLSVGSEDLYRISPTGIAAPDAAPGNGPDVIVNYIKKVRSAIANTSWSNIKVGHVDTWTAWVNGTNNPVIENSDFLGVDAYPYFQKTEDNPISKGASLFNEALDNTRGVAQGKEVWITETGWPLSGTSPYGQAEVGTTNAQTYWQQVGCPNFGSTPTFWYTLYDGVEEDSNVNKGPTPSFSIVKDMVSYSPVFDLSCSNVKSSATNSTSSSSAVSSGFSTSTASGAASTGTGSSGSGAGASNGTYTGTPSSPSSTGTSSSGSGSGSGSSGSGSASGSAASPSASVNTSGASSLKFSLTSMAAVAAAVVAFL